jgi:hypothetical protein
MYVQQSDFNKEWTHHYQTATQHPAAVADLLQTDRGKCIKNAVRVTDTL